MHNLMYAGLMLLSCLVAGCHTQDATQWYRGNTHTHTVICGHADSPPDVVAGWYHERGYHFLILSEHNHFIDPATVELPEPTREDFILIPGVEVTGSKVIHSTAMNVTGVVPWKFNDDDKSKIIQNHVDETIKLGGHLILNHPNFHYAVTAEHMMPVKRLVMFELFNGHPAVHNHGDHEHPSTEAMWDQMLTGGKLIYGVSSDDAHHFQTIAPNVSNPGRGWVMVKAESLDADAITAAMVRGDFYASSGVFFKTCERGPGTYEVVIDTERTLKELDANPLLRGKQTEGDAPAWRIEFIGPGGAVLKAVNGTEGRFKIEETNAYVRVKATYTASNAQTKQHEAYYAWGQPAFTDGRAARQ